MNELCSNKNIYNPNITSINRTLHAISCFLLIANNPNNIHNTPKIGLIFPHHTLFPKDVCCPLPLIPKKYIMDIPKPNNIYISPSIWSNLREPYFASKTAQKRNGIQINKNNNVLLINPIYYNSILFKH